jgi:hypothetical protein
LLGRVVRLFSKIEGAETMAMTATDVLGQVDAHIEHLQELPVAERQSAPTTRFVIDFNGLLELAK